MVTPWKEYTLVQYDQLPFVQMAKGVSTFLETPHKATYDQRVASLREYMIKNGVDCNNQQIMDAMAVVVNWLMAQHCETFNSAEDPETLESCTHQLNGVMASFYTLVELATRQLI